MISANWHTFQVLTKRPERMARILDDDWWAGIYPEARKHIWLGTSMENQKAADERIPWLLKTPAAVRFLSCEPLLGPVDFGLLGTISKDISPQYRMVGEKIHWVICGGESGPKARPMHPQWAQSLRDQCQEAHIPFFFKQWGEWLPAGQMSNATDRTLPEKSVYHDFGDMISVRIGKHLSGRLLDGQEWNEWPE